MIKISGSSRVNLYFWSSTATSWQDAEILSCFFNISEQTSAFIAEERIKMHEITAVST